MSYYKTAKRRINVMNDIPLTIRLPHELNQKLTEVAKGIGMTKTSLIRSAIHDFLIHDDLFIDFSSSSNSDKRDRLVLNVNQNTYNILDKACKKNNESMNSLVVAISFMALERASKWLSLTKH
jgi:predicted DNA-binding protein